MGFGIGVTFMCGNRAGVRSKVDASGRALGHQGDARALLCELAEERWSATANLDRSRSHLNAYGVGGLGQFRSGQAAYDYLCEQVADYDRRAKGDAIADGRRPPRAVRSDAPVMVSVIAEPKAEYMATLSDADKERLCTDCALALVECGYIDDPGDVLVSTVHMDEGVPHLHIAFVNRDPSTGRIGTSRYNDARKMDLLHREFLDALRAKGWDVDGHDTVDRARLKVDKEYKASRKRKRRQQGRSANAYAAERERKALERAEAANRAADDALEDARQAVADAKKTAEELAAMAEALAAERERKKELEASIAALTVSLGAKQKELDGVNNDIGTQRSELDRVTQNVSKQKAESSRLDSAIETKKAELAGVEGRLGNATARERSLERREAAVAEKEAHPPVQYLDFDETVAAAISRAWDTFFPGRPLPKPVPAPDALIDMLAEKHERLRRDYDFLSEAYGVATRSDNERGSFSF